ncbi:membrane protein insertion efficiency factor YidD [Helicobacter didelphidarum]|uniref:Putative membrane protein insertion efficiency factor n=1 Tax=Helicobacter didelphidarum TaxID=2040648 RepID=A0A3D8IND1_9HELI|nr:membrane protein insertion efficiency factor YidD [Helicobacter didelphidarum]RDU66759.1 membrane protein insertion efficiency factor YidD [Helicobacter didelphidarum]
MLRILFIKLIRFYQLFISPFTPQSCRYYPTCSTYGLILMKFDNPLIACVKITLRILSCNPLFEGGFDLPYMYLSVKTQKRLRRNAFQQSHFFSKPIPQEPKKVTYLFIKSDSYLLKLQKFYIISIYLNHKGN